MAREFSVIIERDAEGYYVASVPALRGCHTQATSLDELMARVREAVELCLEVQGGASNHSTSLASRRSPWREPPSANHGEGGSLCLEEGRIRRRQSQGQPITSSITPTAAERLYLFIQVRS